MVLWCLGLGPGVSRPNGQATKPSKAGKVLSHPSHKHNHEICLDFHPVFVQNERHQQTPYYYKRSILWMYSISTLFFSLHVVLVWGPNFSWTSRFLERFGDAGSDIRHSRNLWAWDCSSLNRILFCFCSTLLGFHFLSVFTSEETSEFHIRSPKKKPLILNVLVMLNFHRPFMSHDLESFWSVCPCG